MGIYIIYVTMYQQHLLIHSCLLIYYSHIDTKINDKIEQKNNRKKIIK